MVLTYNKYKNIFCFNVNLYELKLHFLVRSAFTSVKEFFVQFKL